MEANEFLDFNHATQQFTGLLGGMGPDLRRPEPAGHPRHRGGQRGPAVPAAIRHGAPVDALRNVEIMPHSTHRNKSDPEFGVESIREHYKFGRIRLPYKRNSRASSARMKLINELTTYPHGRTDDCVMADWFWEWNLPRIYSPRRPRARVAPVVGQDRPRSTSTGE